MLTYNLTKTIIERGRYVSKEDMQSKIDLFLLANRLTEEQYMDLMALLDEKEELKNK